MFSTRVVHNPNELAALSTAIKSIRDLAVDKSALKEFDAKVDELLAKHTEILNLIAENERKEKSINEREEALTKRHNEVELLHGQNMQKQSTDHINKLEQIRQVMENEQKKIHDTESSCGARLQERETKVESRESRVSIREKNCDAREGTFNAIEEKQKTRTTELQTWEDELTNRHEKISQLEKNALKKG